jgi:hypothetical protein
MLCTPQCAGDRVGLRDAVRAYVYHANNEAVHLKRHRRCLGYAPAAAANAVPSLLAYTQDEEVGLEPAEKSERAYEARLPMPHA